jgi:hypothetical protein
VVSPPGYPHAAAFTEVAESIHYGLLELGLDSELTTSGSLPGRQHIVFGANLLPHYPLPLAPDAILYNLEQVDPGSSWFRPELLDIYRRHRLWDYSPRNAAALAAEGIAVERIVPIGYVPQLTRIAPAPARDIDCLFIGSLNPRRQEILERISDTGLQVHAAVGVYGAERDALIARAKLLLNVHFYEAKVLEMVRISYLLANRCAVLSETGADWAEEEPLQLGVAFAPYDRLVERACGLVADAAERERLAQQGFEIMTARPTSEYLRNALAPA